MIFPAQLLLWCSNNYSFLFSWMNSASELSENVVQEWNIEDSLSSCQLWNDIFCFKHWPSALIPGTTLLYLPVRPSRVPPFGSSWLGHKQQTACSNIAVRDILFLLKYQFLMTSSTNYSGKARRKRAAGTPAALVCTVGCSEFHSHRGSEWTRHLRWGLQNSARDCKRDGENYSAALTRYS